MKNIALGFPNRIDAATLSAGSWMSTLPLDNLKNPRLSKVARSSDAAATSTKFRLALDAARSVAALALLVHNLSVVATVRIRGFSDAGFATTVYDSGAVAAYPAGVIPPALLEWEDDNFWLGTLSQQALAGYRAPFAHYLSSAQTLRYWQIDITDTANGDGYIQIGRVFIGAIWRPTYNMSYGNALGFDDPTTVESSLSGEEFFDVRTRYRKHSLVLERMTKDEAYATAMDMQQLLGISGELLVSGDADDTANQPRRNFLARLVKLSPPAHTSLNEYSVSLELKEKL